MSTNVERTAPAAGNRFVEFDEFIDYQISKTSHGIRSTDLMTGVVGLVLGISAYLLLFILCDHWLVPGGFSVGARTFFWLVGAAGLVGWTMLRIVRPLRRRINVLFAARQIEATQPELKSSLLTLVDLRRAGRSAKSPIKTALEKRAAVGLSRTDVDEAVDRRVLMNTSYALLGVLAVFCFYALFSPKSIAQSALRALIPFSSSMAVTRTRIDRVLPGDAEVQAFSQLEVELEVSGVAPPDATLLFTTADQKFVDEPVTLRETGEGLRRYRGLLLGEDGRGLRQSVKYRIVAGDAESPTYSVRVVQPPSAAVEEVVSTYPEYMQLEEKTDLGGAIDAWEGTRVTVNALANMPVKSATILFSDSEDTSVKAEELPMTVRDGVQLSASWQLAFRTDGSSPKFYRIQVRNEAGHSDPRPALHPLRIRPDLPPTIELLSPKSDITAPVNGAVAVAFKAADPDFQLRSVVMRMERDGAELPHVPQFFSGPPDQPSIDGVHTIRLTDLNLAAGSRLTWWLEARDNLTPFGARTVNRTVTPKLNIDVVDQAPEKQAQDQAVQAQQQAQQALEQARQEQNPEQTQDDPAEPRDDQPQEPQAQEANPPEAQEANGHAEGQPRAGEPGDGQAGAESKGAQGGEPRENDPQSTGGEASRQEQPGAERSGSETEQDPTGERRNDGAGTGSDSAAENDGSTAGGRPPENQRQGAGERRPDSRQPRNPRQSSNAGSDPADRDKTPDDKALDRLLKWAEEQRRAENKNNAQNDSAQESTAPRQDNPSPEGAGDSADQPEGGRQEKGSSPQPPNAKNRKPADRAPQNNNGASGEEPSQGPESPQDRSAAKGETSATSPKNETEGDAAQGTTDQTEQNAASTGREGSDPETRPPAGDSKTEQRGENGSTREPAENEASDPSMKGETNQTDAASNNPSASRDDRPRDQNPASRSNDSRATNDRAQQSATSPREQNAESDGSSAKPSEKQAASEKTTPTGRQPGEKGSPMSDPSSADPAAAEKGATDAGSEPPTAPLDEQPSSPQNSQGPGKDPNQSAKPANAEDNAATSPSKPQQSQEKQSAPGDAARQQPSGETSQSATGEKTTGDAGKRRQPANESSKSSENRGAGREEQPVGQPDEGARSGGEGDPGSSTPGDSGDQKTGGPGEEGQGGEANSQKASPGKNGTGQSSASKGGDKSSNSQKPGSGDSGSEQSSSAEAGGGDSGGEKGGGEGAGKSGGQQGGKSGQSNGKSGGQQGGSAKSSDSNQATDVGAEGETPDSPAEMEPSSTASKGAGESGDRSGEKRSSNDGAQGAGGQGEDAKASPPAKPAGKEGSRQGTPSQSQSNENAGGEPEAGQDPQGGQKGSGKSGGQSGAGQGQGKAGAGSQGTGGTSPSGGPGANPQGGGPAPENSGEEPPADPSAPSADPANLEHKKKAANLALNRLKDTLERGQVDDRLRQQLGFTDDELQEFMDRLEQRLADTGVDQSPEAVARRRQFESLLESLRIDSVGEQRAGGDASGPNASGFNSVRRPAPPEYRNLETQYKQQLNKSNKK